MRRLKLLALFIRRGRFRGAETGTIKNKVMADVKRSGWSALRGTFQFQSERLYASPLLVKFEWARKLLTFY